MKVFNVTVEGTRAILLHNPASMGTSSAGKKKIPTPEEEAAAGCYWTEDKSSLAFPGWNVYTAIVNEARFFRIGKKSAIPFIAGSIEIEPTMIPFGTTEYEIFTKRAVVQRQGIMRSRPMLKRWQLSFRVLVDDEADVAVVKVLPLLLADVGRRAGFGDHRLEKKGPFGKFKVTQFEEA